MSEGRFGFIQRNRNQSANATAHLRKVNLPKLALWGREDLNVDVVHDSAIVLGLVENEQGASQLAFLPDATHALLKAGYYNYQRIDDWPWRAKTRLPLEGRHAYVLGGLDRITSWIVSRTSAGD